MVKSFEHLSNAQLEQYGTDSFPGTSDDAHIVEAHLENCDYCRSRVLEHQRARFGFLADSPVEPGSKPDPALSSACILSGGSSIDGKPSTSSNLSNLGGSSNSAGPSSSGDPSTSVGFSSSGSSSNSAGYSNSAGFSNAGGSSNSAGLSSSGGPSNSDGFANCGRAFRQRPSRLRRRHPLSRQSARDDPARRHMPALCVHPSHFE